MVHQPAIVTSPAKTMVLNNGDGGEKSNNNANVCNNEIVCQQGPDFVLLFEINYCVEGDKCLNVVVSKS